MSAVCWITGCRKYIGLQSPWPMINFIDIFRCCNIQLLLVLGTCTVPILSTYMSAVNSALLFRVVNSTAISAVTGVLEENEKAGFHFVIVNIDGTDVVGSVLFQYVVPRLTSVPENRIIEAYV